MIARNKGYTGLCGGFRAGWLLFMGEFFKCAKILGVVFKARNLQIIRHCETCESKSKQSTMHEVRFLNENSRHFNKCREKYKAIL